MFILQSRGKTNKVYNNMKLKEWREINELSQEELASKLMVEQAHISYWENGKTPRKGPLKAIMKLTKGKVTANDFI